MLTRLLRESVAGDSRTAMIACVSLAREHDTHTLTTLRYAEQARDVRTRPVQQPHSVIKVGLLTLKVDELYYWHSV